MQRDYDETKQKDYWNSVADVKDFHSKLDIDEFSKYVNKDGLILDYGCGYGRTLAELQQHGYKNLIGLDFSEKMLERARREISDIEFILKNTDEIKFKDNHFDAVILMFVFATVYTDQDQDNIINDIKRLLKPGGIIFISDALLKNDERNINRYNHFKDKYGVYGVFEREDGMIARHFQTDRVKKITDNFEKILYNTYVVPTQNGNTTNGFMFMGKNIK